MPKTKKNNLTSVDELYNTAKNDTYRSIRNINKLNIAEDEFKFRGARIKNGYSIDIHVWVKKIGTDEGPVLENRLSTSQTHSQEKQQRYASEIKLADTDKIKLYEEILQSGLNSDGKFSGIAEDIRIRLQKQLNLTPRQMGTYVGMVTGFTDGTRRKTMYNSFVNYLKEENPSLYTLRKRKRKSSKRR